MLTFDSLYSNVVCYATFLSDKNFRVVHVWLLYETNRKTYTNWMTEYKSGGLAKNGQITRALYS